MLEFRQIDAIELRDWRLSKRLTQESAALIFGTSLKNWSNWERGKYNPPATLGARLDSVTEEEICKVAGKREVKVARIGLSVSELDSLIEYAYNDGFSDALEANNEVKYNNSYERVGKHGGWYQDAKKHIGMMEITKKCIMQALGTSAPAVAHASTVTTPKAEKKPAPEWTVTEDNIGACMLKLAGLYHTDAAVREKMDRYGEYKFLLNEPTAAHILHQFGMLYPAEPEIDENRLRELSMALDDLPVTHEEFYLLHDGVNELSEGEVVKWEALVKKRQREGEF